MLQGVLKLAPGKALHHEVRAFGVQATAVLSPQPLRRLLHLSPRLFGQPGDADDQAGEGPVPIGARSRTAPGGGRRAARGRGGRDGGGGGRLMHPREQQPRAPPAGHHLHPATRHRWCGGGGSGRRDAHHACG
uniref:Uncharacterized protein n=1 Tax=Arundo donax TaxID=35708 RepID=A0A0A9CQC6_ARUDO